MTAILIATLSLLRGDARILARLPRWMAPTGHFILYGVFACLLTLDHAVHILDAEYAQKFRPGRYARVGDVCIDAAGATVGVLIALTLPWAMTAG